VADDDKDVFGFERGGGAQHVGDERAAAEFVQDFGLIAFHACAQPGGQNQDIGVCVHDFDLTMMETGTGISAMGGEFWGGPTRKGSAIISEF
jgi:hypothetical protein